MKPGYQKKAVLWGAPGLIFHEIGFFGSHLTESAVPRDVLVAIGVAGTLGTIALIIGFAYYVKGKGHHGAWALLGLIGILGVVGIMLLSDRVPEERLARSES